LNLLDGRVHGKKMVARLILKLCWLVDVEEEEEEEEEEPPLLAGDDHHGRRENRFNNPELAAWAFAQQGRPPQHSSWSSPSSLSPLAASGADRREYFFVKKQSAVILLKFHLC
jgi:hypothetical protein